MAASLQHTYSRESIVPEPSHSESLRRTSGVPQADLRRTSGVPQAYLRRTSGGPQAYLRRTSGGPQAMTQHCRCSTVDRLPESSNRSAFISTLEGAAWWVVGWGRVG
eukprot:scaffold90866_cov61-Phaeocystis_antarctica.AAC.4